jgi:uncharacterized repeat protein (TIGR03803 family)
MSSWGRFFSARLLLTCAAFCSLATAAFSSGPEQVVYSFGTQGGGNIPVAGLVADAAGNLYGTNRQSSGVVGDCNCGAVFELSPPATAGGAWTGTMIHIFTGGEDGSYPVGTLILDNAGNLYGTTRGDEDHTEQASKGTVFEFSPPSSPGGAWTETILWNFGPVGGVARGFAPWGKLEVDALGNLYGTAHLGGNLDGCPNCGLVFELVKPRTAGVSWKEKVLYEFGAVSNDGTKPAPNLLLRGGVLYGTTDLGGAFGKGTVFQLTRQSGFWAETILHSFDGTDGIDPHGGLIADPEGNLYGTTLGSPICSAGCGTIYELSPPGVPGGPWQETTLYKFEGPGDGSKPNAALWRDKTGALWGTATSGGIISVDFGTYGGTMFKLRPPSTPGGSWEFVTAHEFGIRTGDAVGPYGELILRDGTFYGTSFLGGSLFNGTVFSYTP